MCPLRSRLQWQETNVQQIQRSGTEKKRSRRRQGSADRETGLEQIQTGQKRLETEAQEGLQRFVRADRRGQEDLRGAEDVSGWIFFIIAMYIDYNFVRFYVVAKRAKTKKNWPSNCLHCSAAATTSRSWCWPTTRPASCSVCSNTLRSPFAPRYRR